MKVLIGAAQVNGHRAVEVLDAVVHGWREGNPQAELDPVVASDGAADLLDAVQAHRGGRRGVITVLAGDGVTRVPVVTLRVAGTLYLQASDVLATTAVTPTRSRTPPARASVPSCVQRWRRVRAAS